VAASGISFSGGLKWLFGPENLFGPSSLGVGIPPEDAEDGGEGEGEG